MFFSLLAEQKMPLYHIKSYKGNVTSMNDETTASSQKNKTLLVLTISLLVLSPLFSQIIDPMIAHHFKIPPLYIYVVFNIICIVTFFLIPGCNPFAWSKTLIGEKKSRPKYRLHMGIAIGLSLVVISLKTMVNHWTNGLDGFSPFVMFSSFDIVFYFLGAFSEEVLYKAGLLRILFNLKIPHIVSMLIVSVIFALQHFVFDPMYIAALIVIQMFFMAIFSLYPSLTLLTLLHFAWNLSIFA